MSITPRFSKSKADLSLPFFCLFIRLRWSSVFFPEVYKLEMPHGCFHRLALCLCRLGFWVPAGTWGFLFWISPNPEKVSSCCRWTPTEAALFIWHAALDLQVTFKSHKHSSWVDAAWCSTRRCIPRGWGFTRLLMEHLGVFFELIFFPLSLSLTVPRRPIIVHV